MSPPGTAVKPRNRPWRDNIEAMTMAIVMALLLKCFIVEAYKIPTGSMQPTLVGDKQAGVQDRILVDKLSYVFGEPERWDVAVFRYPLNRAQNFVKRIVGVGPEDFRVHNGDLWHRADGSEPWKILRRPPEVQVSSWLKLDLENPPETSWSVVTDGNEWEVEGRTIQARGNGTAGFRASHSTIQDRYFDGYPESLIPLMEESRPRQRGSNSVGDVRLEGEVIALAGTRVVRLELREGRRTYRFTLPGPDAEEGARASIELIALGHRGPNETPPPPKTADEPWRLAVGETVRFQVQNLDDRLTFTVPGSFELEQDIPPRYDQESSVRLTVEGEGADFSDLMVARDIYYRAQGQTTETTIPVGHYYMLGDNTRNSSDSREWYFDLYRVPGEGDGEPRMLRSDGCRPANAYPMEIGDTLHEYIIDEFGERRWIPMDELEEFGTQDEPFVPREMIQGRALAVFWPLNPLNDIYRLKWIH